MKIAIQGGMGSNHQIILEKLYNQVALPIPCVSFEEVFEKVKSNECKFGLIAIENSIAGSIHNNYDLLENNNLEIIWEGSLRIRHSLIGLTNDISKIKIAYSHEMALKQCKKFLLNNKIEPREYHDTSEAVKYIRSLNDPTVAAIAASKSIEYFGGVVIKNSIEDFDSNFTRFILITKPENKINFNENLKYNKFIISVILPDEIGSLYRILKILADNNLTLSRIESRPIPHDTWKYRFYIDLISLKKDINKSIDVINSLPCQTRIFGFPDKGINYDQV